MDFYYRVLQVIKRKRIDSVAEYTVMCECIDFSTAERICNALTSACHFEDDRYYMEFCVECQTSDEF